MLNKENLPSLSRVRQQIIDEIIFLYCFATPSEWGN